MRSLMHLLIHVGQAITVEYTATVNSNAVTNVEYNYAELEYTNNPDGSTTKVNDKETVYTAKIIIDKYVSGNEDNKLANAKFVLINNDTVDGSGDGIANNANTGKYYMLDNGKVTWVDKSADATVVTTDSEGAAQFVGLEDGEYLLREIEAPAGYNLLNEDVKITISGSSTDTTTLTHTEKVENNTGSILPETGGMGTTIFYILGGLMAVGAGVLLIAKKRMGEDA